MNEDKYNVRIKFEHGNPITLDLKGCGNLYIQPLKEYFFEGAPMQFINYLSQLRRLGVTYFITDDKRGCYLTINMSHYFDNMPSNIMGKIRNNFSNSISSEKEEISNKKSKKEEQLEKEIPNLIPEETFAPQEVKEIFISDIPTTETAETTEVEPITTEESEVKTEEPEVEETSIDIEKASKKELIDYAHSLGLTDVSDLYTKKEIREAITNKLSE